MSTTYDVGYKKPPKDHQFKPGKSGNPKGKPCKVPLSFKPALSNELWKEVLIQNGSKKEKVTYMELYARMLVAAGLKDIKVTMFLAKLTNGFEVPMPSDKGMIFLNPKKVKALDQLEQAFTIWGEEYKQKTSLGSDGAAAAETADQSDEI